ncbi:MAG: SRPBCC domain-containing protein [Burkholderiaceae bacterium]
MTIQPSGGPGQEPPRDDPGQDPEHDPARDASTSRRLPASPARVYAAFGDPGELARWWGPAGFGNSFETFEFRPGGDWRFTMHGPDGRNYANQSRFLVLEPGRQVLLRHLNAPAFELRVLLEPAGEGQTLLHWRQRFDDAGLAAQLRALVEPANEQNLDRLAALLAGAR